MPTLTIREAANYFGKSGQVATAMRAAANKGLLAAAVRAKTVIVTREVPNRTPPPIDKGVYRAGWQVEKLPNGAAIYNAVPHAAAIEHGVPAGNVVLSTKFQVMLAEWIMRKGGPRQTTPLAAGAPGGGKQPPVNRTGVARAPGLGRFPPEVWSAAAAIMFALKRRGIFARGKGLRVLTDFSRVTLPAIIREEVNKELKKAVGK